MLEFRQDVASLARRLLGATLQFQGAGGLVVETEAYDLLDPASHSYGGLTPRSAVMFGPPGRAYVYRSYGVHWCLNLVGGEAPGAAVLIRALQPTTGLEGMRERRGGRADRMLCSGPGRLCQALGITGEHNGLPLTEPPFALRLGPALPPDVVLTGPRIGLTKGVSTPWRFGVKGSLFLSRRFSP